MLVVPVRQRPLPAHSGEGGCRTLRPTSSAAGQPSVRGTHFAHLLCQSRVGCTPWLSLTADRVAAACPVKGGIFVEKHFHNFLKILQVKNVNALNDLKWQLCAICSREPITTNCKGLWERFASAKDHFFEGFAIRLSGQFPLPGFQITHWNSLPAPTGEQQQQQNAAAASSAAEEAYNGTYLEMEGSILRRGENNLFNFGENKLAKIKN
jgi:hypothetical protein